MAALHNRYNNENILVRAVIAGLLNILNNKITYEQVWSNEDIETITIPWYYDMSGDERFMQDFYTHYAHCLPPRPVDGNFDRIPRGIITYKGSTVDSARITSRYVQANFIKEVNGQLQTYRSFLYSIPLDINIDCEMQLDTQITALKVEQAIREAFYKTVTFYVYYRGMRLGCTVGFPEDIILEKNIQYSFEPENKIKINFSLQVEAYQPVFDSTTEMNAENSMKSIGYRLIDKGDISSDGIITITTDYTNTVIPKGYPLLIEWDYTHENAIINKVDIAWTDINSSSKNIIAKGVDNHEYYLWNIPESFNLYKSPEILWDTTSAITAYRQPVIKIIPNISTNEIDSSSFYIVDSGYFLSPTSDASLGAVLEMRDSNNRVVYSGDSSLYFNITEYKINESNPVTLPYGNIVYPGTIDYKVIDLYVVNSAVGHSIELTVDDALKPYGVIRNVIIV